MNTDDFSEKFLAVLTKNLPAGSLDGINLIINNQKEELLAQSKINILWNNSIYNQKETQKFITTCGSKLDAVIYTSHWQYNNHREYSANNYAGSYVIQEAAEPIASCVKDRKIKIVYAGWHDKELELLLDAFNVLKRRESELHIFCPLPLSNVDIYAHNHSLSNRASNMPNVVYHGYKEADELRKFQQKAHIFACPYVDAQPSCLPVIEASMDGLYIVATNIGPLPEILGKYVDFVLYTDNQAQLATRFANALDEAVDSIVNGLCSRFLNEQTKYFRRNYSWENRCSVWVDVLNQVKSPYVNYIGS